MRMTIYVGMAAAAFVCLALIVAQPDMQGAISGKVADPVAAVLLGAFGPVGFKVVICVVLVSFMSCILSLQAATSRLVFAYARDKMVVASDYLSSVSPHTHVPVRALLLSGVIAAIIICLGLFFANAIGIIVASAIIGIYAAFQMIVLGAMSARMKGWLPSGKFRLGGWAYPVNVIALIYGIGAIADMAWPRTPNQSWYINWSMSVTWLGIIVIGALYMLIARPYDHGTAPAGDAWKLGRTS
jgi:amino acid transporter